MIRNLGMQDLAKVIEIHRKYYAEEFSINEFFNKITGLAAAFNNKDEIIVVGGVRPILEIVNMTNKDIDVKERRDALLEILEMNKRTARSLVHKELHAFVQDEKWERHLIKSGFRHTVGRALVINI
jgi:hypothetical protein